MAGGEVYQNLISAPGLAPGNRENENVSGEYGNVSRRSKRTIGTPGASGGSIADPNTKMDLQTD